MDTFYHKIMKTNYFVICKYIMYYPNPYNPYNPYNPSCLPCRPNPCPPYPPYPPNPYPPYPPNPYPPNPAMTGPQGAQGFQGRHRGHRLTANPLGKSRQRIVLRKGSQHRGRPVWLLRTSTLYERHCRFGDVLASGRIPADEAFSTQSSAEA